MKVLKNNFNEIAACVTEVNLKPYPRKLICENCESELEYEKSDMKVGVYGIMHVKCPLCGYNNMIYGNENDITLTVDNIEFPTHFHHTSKETGAVNVCNNEFVKECVRKAINYFRENKEEFAYFTGTGNTMVYVFRFEGDEEYEVAVANDYYETYIPFKPEDYRV